MRHQSLGRTGTPNLKALGAMYREAEANEAPALQEAERQSQATQGALPLLPLKKSQSAFGPRSREQGRAAMKLHRFALWQRHHQQAPHLRAQAVAAQVEEGGSLDAAISAARKHDLLDGAGRRRTAQEHIECLQQFSQVADQEHQDLFKKVCPGFPLQSAMITPIPDASSHTVLLRAAPDPSTSLGVAWASHSRNTNLAPVLEKQWDAMHQVIMEGDMPEAQPPVSDKPSACRLAGTCVCSVAGRQLQRLVFRAAKLFKDQFRNRLQKGLLSSGSGCTLPATNRFLH